MLWQSIIKGNSMLFHFTSGDRAEGLARDGLLPLGVVTLDGRNLYKRCVWLTDEPNPQLQPWAHLDGSRDKTLVRLAVEPDPSLGIERWFEYARARRADPRWVGMTLAFGSEHWWLTELRVPLWFVDSVHVRGQEGKVGVAHPHGV